MILTREIKHRIYGKRQREFVPRGQVSSLLVVYCSFIKYMKIGRFTSILSIRIFLSCFYLPTSHFDNFSN